MNTKRAVFWSAFVIVLALIVWGLIAAMNKGAGANGRNISAPPAVSQSDHVRGSDNAPVTVIEYSDFQCPACESYYYFVARLWSEASTTTRFIYRHFPLSQHPNAMPAAMASEAAGAQGKFWEMYDRLFQNHADWTELSDPTDVFVGYAAKIGLDVSRFKADLSSSTLRDYINADADGAIKIGVDSTPTFFVNGKAIVNPSSYDEFKALVEATASSSPQ